ncbi:Sensory neuron membrane protein 2 [Eufriesea mexicana]|uniref:Sensory neuron membrane protein 2 n=1 Tax=Eufriesea mexicana TaxID=516756 RepID=A0A310SJA4_9HYME|nr:Sensory neuron membrane protein 2 [Eufriesea mexicana]
MHLTFACYLFNVTNPDEVMRGSYPNLAEVGPITYDEIYEKQVMSVDEESDEITYITRSTYTFNKYLSLNITKRNKINILNPAYIGTISMLSSLPPDIMKRYGNDIPKLFPNRSSIFLKASPMEILFDGVKVSCNLKKFPELDMVCKTLISNPPPVLRETDREGIYLLSIFQRMNYTFRGPFSVNRGLKDITRLGDITSYKGKRVQTLWSSDSCNTVRGTDTITWAPLVEPLPFVSTFVPELCRTVEADYEDEVSIHGLTGSRFVMKERTWLKNETECYCVEVNHVPQCLPQGLIDVTECQGVPVILSEPHFLHGDPQLLTYAQGLSPDESVHGTYIVIEPYTGTPLSGEKKTQLNLELKKQPVKLLSNVSEGFFPLMWTVEADYEDEVSIHGLTGSRFVMKERTWLKNETECYCVEVNHVPQCLPQGLIDVTECQGVPVILSEPHFLHGDPQLLTYAQGLSPDESVHGTYIVIEPYTGTPLSGEKKTQLNLELKKQPVKLLSNVSEGFFPLMWCGNGNTPSLSIIGLTYQVHRLIQVISYLDIVPLMIGIHMALMTTLYCNCTRRKVQPTVSIADSLLISSNSQSNNSTHRPRRQAVQAFEQF